MQVPSDSVFDIQNSTGEIRTRVELDFETQPVHYVVVTAVDDGDDVKKSSTATVTVVVQDTADEVSTCFFLWSSIYDVTINKYRAQMSNFELQRVAHK